MATKISAIKNLVNGEEYSYVNMRIVLGGVMLAGVAEISYNTTQETALNYGVGNEPVSEGFGPKAYEASMSLHQSELYALAKAIKNQGQDLLDARFDILVIYARENGAQKTSTRLVRCKFKTRPGGGAQGDMALTRQLDLHVPLIEYDVSN